MDRVRPLGAPAPVEVTPRRPPLWGLLAVVVAIGGWLLVFGSEASEEPLLATGLTAAETADALAVVESFTTHLEAGDGRAAGAVLKEDWTSLELPGLPFRFVRAGASNETVGSTLSFYGSVITLELGLCRVDPPRPINPRTRVVCSDAAVTGDYADAVHASGIPTTTIFEIEGDEIVSVLRAPVAAPAMLHYCAWAERSVGATGLFDTKCWPVTAEPEDHAELAARYVALGRPRAEDGYAAVRLNAAIVDQFVSLHNLGAKTPLLFAPGEIVGLPGVVGALDPAQVDQRGILAWSSEMYQIDLGSCQLGNTPTPASISVSCPDAHWGGPLVDALALNDVSQPVEFEVAWGTILHVRGETNTALEQAIAALCSHIQVHHPARAPSLFTDGCTPAYNRDSAQQLLALAADR